jgi:CRISPR/Cas system-associated protein Csx1
MADTPTKVVVDCSTGITEVIPLTQDEIVELEIARVAAENERKIAETQAAARAEAKAALLKQLGITEEQAKLLLS